MLTLDDIRMFTSGQTLNEDDQDALVTHLLETTCKAFLLRCGESVKVKMWNNPLSWSLFWDQYFAGYPKSDWLYWTIGEAFRSESRRRRGSQSRRVRVFGIETLMKKYLTVYKKNHLSSKCWKNCRGIRTKVSKILLILQIQQENMNPIFNLKGLKLKKLRKRKRISIFNVFINWKFAIILDLLVV